MLKLGYVILYVENVSQTIEFYERAFGFEKKLVTPEGDYGELESGDTTVAFASIALGNTNFKNGFQIISNSDKPIGVELVFVTENIEADFKTALDEGASEYEPLSRKPWGQTVGYLRDINGFLIEICTPITT